MLLSLRNLSKVYQSKSVNFKALDNISFDVNEGELLSITGKSGSGKSTLLHIMGGLDSCYNGCISLNGNEYKNINKKQMAAIRNKEFGFIFQNFYLEPNYSVYRNVEIPLLLCGDTGKKNKKIIEDMLYRMDLSEKIYNKAKTLSGGEQQRVCIARALINNPKIIFADEPCGNLDTKNSKTIMEILFTFKEKGKTVIIVTHDIKAAEQSDRIIELCDGKIINNEKNVYND